MKIEEMERLWDSLSGETDGIYRRYAQARALRSQETEEKKKRARAEYESEKNRLSAAAKIRQLNTKAALADHGLAKSGESLHAQLMNDYTHSQEAQEAAKRYSNTVGELELAQSKADAQSEAELAKEMASLKQSLYGFGLEEKKLEQQEREALRQREHEDAQLAKELEQREKESLRETQQRENQSIRETQQRENASLRDTAQREKESLRQNQQKQEQSRQDQLQWEGEQTLDRERLEEQKRQFDREQERLSQEERGRYEEEIRKLQERLEEDEGRGTIPDKTPKTLFKDLLYAAEEAGADLAAYDVEAYEKKVKEYMRSKLSSLLRDESLDADYRKSLAIYGMLGGYLEEEDDDVLEDGESTKNSK